MPVALQTPYKSHTANGVSTTFGYDFQLILASDLEVKLDGVVQVSGYTVNGVGVQAGGDVLFSSPPANNTLVEFTRKIPRTRSTNYPYLGDLPEATVDADFDRTVQMIQDLAYFADTLGIKLPAGDSRAPMTIPSVADRISKFFAFDANGDAMAALGVTDVPATAWAATLLDDLNAQQARNTLGLGVGADIASAATLDLSNGPRVRRVTGTVTTTAFTLDDSGPFLVTADAAWPVNVSGALVYTCNPEDSVLLWQDGDGVQHALAIPVAGYVAKAGNETIAGVKTFGSQPILPQRPALSAQQSLNTKSSVEFLDIPSWANKITLTLVEASSNGTAHYLVQGGAGSFETSGYAGSGAVLAAASGYAAFTNGFGIFSNTAGSTHSGTMTLTRHSGDTWVAEYTSGFTASGPAVGVSGGNKTFTGALDRIRLITTDTFDNGFASIRVEE